MHCFIFLGLTSHSNSHHYPNQLSKDLVTHVAEQRIFMIHTEIETLQTNSLYLQISTGINVCNITKDMSKI